jgi:hypothetical protein
MNTILTLLAIGLVCNSYMSWTNWHSARVNRQFFETYLKEKYGADWRLMSEFNE